VDSFVVPAVPGWARIVCGAPLVLVTVMGLVWGLKGLRLSWHVARGLVPPPAGSTAGVSGGLGLVLYSTAVSAALGCGVLLAYVLTAEPAIVDGTGVAGGAWLLAPAPEVIAWQDVSEVYCGMPPRTDVIRRLVVRSTRASVELGSAGRDLAPIRAFIARHVRAGVVRPCRHEMLHQG
jgi:hypothetical protein